ncbi:MULTISPECIES: TIGR03085 family metal-binding protein [Corynebacterium]|uniref:TIGR03085 family metal-binding protein n=1 Tax=Corynebacterium TaxID=1716 RepID=UPI00178C7F61|nr:MULTISPECIES: TIGR03085 family metal-binding protein [Corynebacterium]
MSFSQSERQKLAALFTELGPTAPTLCEGWDTQYLAAHLLARETNVRAAGGIVIPQLADAHDDAVEQLLADKGYETIVEEWAAGPPTLLKPFDSVMNTAENFVHHEDVRRAQEGWTKRELSTAEESELYKVAKTLGRTMVSSKGSAVACVPTTSELSRFVVGDKRKVASAEDQVVTVIGDIGEIVLWLFGREPVDVRILGDESGVKKKSL